MSLTHVQYHLVDLFCLNIHLMSTLLYEDSFDDENYGRNRELIFSNIIDMMTLTLLDESKTWTWAAL